VSGVHEEEPWITIRRTTRWADALAGKLGHAAITHVPIRHPVRRATTQLSQLVDPTGVSEERVASGMGSQRAAGRDGAGQYSCDQGGLRFETATDKGWCTGSMSGMASS
jgi:hypothetical protein